MSRPVSVAALVVGAWLCAAGAAARAQPGATPPADPAPAPDTVTDTGWDTDTDAEPDVAGERELGGRLGVAMGNGLTPGGLRAAGIMLYRLSRDDWFEGSLAFTFGRSRAACFTDRDGAFTCDHGVIDGAAIDIVAGVRRFVAVRDRFAPYLRAGLGLRVAGFGGDDVRGLAIPVVAGVGVRGRVSEMVSVGADAGLELGVGWFDHDLGAAAQVGVVLQATVDVRLD